MPGRRPVNKGSFGSHFDELVALFPDIPPTPVQAPHKRPAKLQEKLDIHAALLARAWQLETR